MKPKNNLRYIAAGVVVCLMFAYVVVGLANLQLNNEVDYSITAENKTTKTIRLTGSRGMITDIDGVILAQDEKVYNVTFQRDSTENSKTDYSEFTNSIIETIGIIEKYGGTLCVTFEIERDAENNLWTFNFGEASEAALATRETQWRSNHYLSKADYPTAESCLNNLRARYQMAEDIDETLMLQVMAVYSTMQMNLFLSVPITIATDIPFTTVSEIEGRAMLLRGMAIEVGTKRVYPRSTLAAQLIGYTGAISSLTTYYDDLEPQGYKLNDRIGIAGIESSMESWLTQFTTQSTGSRVMEKDSGGSLTRELSYTAPSDGNNVRLTINTAYQTIAEQAIASNVERTRNLQEKKLVNGDWLESNKEDLLERDFVKNPLKLANTGVLIVLDVNTGNVLAMAQYPTYDLNAIVAGGDLAAQILTDERGLTMNYAIQTRAEPGSIFKMVTSMAALLENELDPYEEIDDEGRYMAHTNNILDAPKCWISENYLYQHQNQTIVEGLKNSCNYFFYTLGTRLGEERLYRYSAMFGLTSKTGLDLPGELRSMVGNQQNLYDDTISLNEQATSIPYLVAESIKAHITQIAGEYGIVYDEDRLNKCAKAMMDMALNTPQDTSTWIPALQRIVMEQLNMERSLAFQARLMNDIYNYLNEIKWGGSQTIQVAIGQSITLLTPAAVARYAATLANGGIVYNLNIINSIMSSDGDVISTRTPSTFGVIENAGLYLPYIKEGMKGVVDESGTAGKYFEDWDYTDQIFAKTGTSQISPIDVENNSWFIMLTPYENPQLAVISFIPNGFSGAEASHAARDFVTWWFEEQNKTVETFNLAPGNSLTP